MSRPLLLLMVCALLAGLVAMGGVLAHPLTTLPEDPFVEGHFVGALLGGEGLLWTDRLLPEGGPLRPLMWPTALLATVLGPALALNLVWTLVPLYNAVCGYLFGRGLGASPSGAALTGALLAAAPFARTTLGNGQVEQAALGGAALVWAACLWRHKLAMLAAPAALLAVGLATPNVGLAASLGLLVLMPWRLWKTPRPGLMMAGLLVLALLPVRSYHAAAYQEGPRVFAPRTAAPADLELSHAVGWSATRSENLSDATLRSLVEPVGPRGFEAAVVHSPFLGWSLIALAAGGLALGRRRLDRVLGVAGLLLLASLGQKGGVMPLLGMVVPSVAESGSAYRLVVGLICALAGMASALEARWGRWTPLLGLLALFETLVLPNHALVLPARAALPHPELAALQVEGAVLDLPLADVPCTDQAMHYLSQVAQHDGSFLHGEGSLALHPELQQRARLIRGAFDAEDCPMRIERALRPMELDALILHTHESSCSPPPLSCLEQAFGPPERGDGVLWWTF